MTLRPRNPLTIAILGAIAVHAVVLLFGGLLSPSRPPQPATDKPEAPSRRPPVQRVNLSMLKPAAPPPPPPAEPQAAPQRPAEVEVATSEPPPPKSGEDATRPESDESASELPAASLAQAVASQTPATAPDPPAAAASPVVDARPDTPADLAGKLLESPATAPDSGPARLAAASASEARILGGPSGGGSPPATGHTAPPTRRPPAAIAATPTLATSQSPATSQPPKAATARSEAAAATPHQRAPGSPALRHATRVPERLGPAWKVASDAIGPVPAASQSPAIRPTAKRSREIPPVNIDAAVARTSVEYKPLNLPGDRRPTSQAAGAIASTPPAFSADAASSGGLRSAAASSGSGFGKSGEPNAGGNPGGDAADRGNATAGNSVPQDPVARIAWGDATQALQTLDAARMRLVVVDEDLKVIGGIDRSGAGWLRTEAPSQMAAFSNRVRVVDHVSGFAEPSALCIPGEHLALIVPVGLDRRIEKAMDAAARREGLSRRQVAACYGRLVVQPTGVEFQIDRVEKRSAP